MIPHVFLIVADVEESRLAEKLRHFAYQVAAYTVVFRRGYHSVVFPEPDVVRGGKVELGNRLQPHATKTRKLRCKFILAPCTLD